MKGDTPEGNMFFMLTVLAVLDYALLILLQRCLQQDPRIQFFFYNYRYRHSLYSFLCSASLSCSIYSQLHVLFFLHSNSALRHSFFCQQARTASKSGAQLSGYHFLPQSKERRKGSGNFTVQAAPLSPQDFSQTSDRKAFAQIACILCSLREWGTRIFTVILKLSP